MNKLLCKKGFTLVEVLVAAVLTGFMLVAVFNIVALANETVNNDRTIDALATVCITIVESERYTLSQTKALDSEIHTIVDSLGTTYYTISYYATALEYPGAYKLTLNARADNGQTFSREIILYAEA